MTTKKSTVIQVQPSSITVIGPMLQAMQQVAVHIRSGYYPHPDVPMTVFASAGTVSVPLIIGTPDQHYVNAAAVSAAEAAARVHADYLKDVELAAARQIEAAALAEKEAKKAALLADQKAQLAALEASFTAQ